MLLIVSLTSEHWLGSATSPRLRPSEAAAATTGCPASNGTAYTAGYGGTFLKLCRSDWGGGARDMLGVMVQSLDFCIEACAGFNKLKAFTSARCSGVAFVPSWSDRNTSAGEDATNCVLKSGGRPGVPNQLYEVVSAGLI
jgi:hypothetical protein